MPLDSPGDTGGPPRYRGDNSPSGLVSQGIEEIATRPRGVRDLYRQQRIGYRQLRGAASMRGAHIDGIRGVDNKSARGEAVCEKTADALDTSRSASPIADPSPGAQRRFTCELRTLVSRSPAAAREEPRCIAHPQLSVTLL